MWPTKHTEGFYRRKRRKRRGGGRTVDGGVGVGVLSQRSQSADTEAEGDGRRIGRRAEGGGRPTEHTEQTEGFEQEKTERTEDRGRGRILQEGTERTEAAFLSALSA